MPKPPPAPTKNPKAAKGGMREENLARALRDNLRRRKAQAQARAADTPDAAAKPGDKKAE